MINASYRRVNISLKRVQTFIFEVPRLKAMLGANALIGETLRHDLPKLAIDCGSVPMPLECVGYTEVYKLDPLKPPDDFDRDDPEALYRKGLLSRDGGHFTAIFSDEDSAKKFTTEAETLITKNLPGVLFDIEIRPLESEDSETSAEEVHLLDLPVLQICQETGHEVASKQSESDKKTWAAQSVQHRMDAGQRFYDGRTKDIIGLMQPQLGLTKESGWQAPKDLKDLCSGQYLALIHADGNGVGKRYVTWKETGKAKISSGQDELSREAHGEAFYHSMRVAVRRAIVQALTVSFKENGGIRPYEILMLGGDDLLIACRADKALPFAVAYAKELKEIYLADYKPLDVGIGVAIAKATYPFHRLHELAEALASSAKRLSRAKPNAGSVIDWQVVTNSWFDDVAEARCAADFRHYSVDGKEECIVLSQRPYAVLGEKGLEGLLKASVELDRKINLQGTEGAARSPLRALRAAFESGQRSGQMAFGRLDKDTRQILEGGNGESPWIKVEDNSHHLTRVLDIIGLREIAHLGSRKHD